MYDMSQNGRQVKVTQLLKCKHEKKTLLKVTGNIYKHLDSFNKYKYMAYGM